MRNSIIAGRHMAMRIVLVQVGITAIVAALCFLMGARSALAALLGGGLVALSTGLLAIRLFSAQAISGELVLARLLAGIVLKWMLVLGGFYLILARWQLPPLPAIAGLVSALLGNWIGLKFKD